MAGLFCRFLDFRTLSITNISIPSKHLSSAVLIQPHSSKIIRTKRRKCNLALLCKTSSQEFDVVSTQEHSDGSFIFRFGHPNEVVENVKIKEPVTVSNEIKKEGKDGTNLLKITDVEATDETKATVTITKSIRVVEKENVSSEMLLEIVEVSNVEVDVSSNPGIHIENVRNEDEDSKEIESPIEVSNIETEVSSISGTYVEDIGTVEKDLNEEHDNSSKIEEIELPIEVSNIETEASSNSGTDVEDIGTVEEDLNKEHEKSSKMEIVESKEKEIGDLEDGYIEGEIQDGIFEESSQLKPDLNLSEETEETVMIGIDSENDSIQLLPLSGPTIDEVTGNNFVEEEDEEDEIQNNDLQEDSRNELVTKMESFESDSTRQEILMPEFVLSYGAALLPHPSKVLSGGEDAYFVCGKKWIGVADGVGQWSLEGTNPGVYAQELMKNCEKLVTNCNDDSINHPVELLNRGVTETHSPGSSSVLIAKFDGKALEVANVGDSGFIILRNGIVYQRSSPLLYAFNFPIQIERGDDPSRVAELYKIDLEEEDVIIIATDGLFDNLHDQEISRVILESLADEKEPEEISQLLANKAQEVGRSAFSRSPFADNAQAAGYRGYTGGNLDDVTVSVSIVQRQYNP